MGGQISLETKLSENELVRRFSGLEPITDNDPFWNTLVSFNLASPKTRREQRRVEEGMRDALESLMYNTPTTGNFAALVRVTLRRASELKAAAQTEDKISLWQTKNALIVLRLCVTFLAERLSEPELLKTFCKNVLTQDGKVESVNDAEEMFESPSEELLTSLVEILVDLAANAITTDVHVEAARCLLALLSTQLSHEKPNPHSRILTYLMQGRCAIHAPPLTKILLRNFLEHRKTVLDESAFEAGGSLVIGFASSMWAALSKTLVEDETSEGAEVDELDQKLPVASLGNLSLILLLVLTSHTSHDKDAPKEEDKRADNPYRQALASFHNAQEVSTLGGAGTGVLGTFKVDYGALYQAECAEVEREPEMLLLYLLLHRNSAFRNYVLSRVNLEDLVIPILKVLYAGSGPQTSSHHVYLALINILILSEDDFFAKIIHETTVKSVDWYKERVVNETTLGGLIVLVLCRTIQHNIVKVRDRYLHTNCLAALANLSGLFKNLGAGVAQRLVGLLEVLTKRHAKLVQHMRLSADLDLSAEKAKARSHQEDITALEEGIRTILEIINSTLTHSLRHNPHLVYTMLYQSSLFHSFHQHPMFQDLIWNISAVLNHFASRVGTLEKGASAAEVLDVISKGALQWPTDRLKKFPELKFKYVEDDCTEDFFVPYVWGLVYKTAGVPFDPDRIRLFHPNTLSPS